LDLCAYLSRVSTITLGIRMTWQYIENGILLRNIEKHDETLKNP
jgi:hypothetical protein